MLLLDIRMPQVDGVEVLRRVKESPDLRKMPVIMLTTTDGQVRTAFPLIERAGNHTYVGLDGRTFEVKIEEIAKRERLPVSIMPEGLAMRLADEEIRDLLAYLRAQRG